MVANKNRLKLIVLNILFLLSYSIYADTDVSNDDVINFLYKNVAQSTTALGEIVNLCETKKTKSNVVKLNAKQLHKINAKDKDVIIVLTYLSFLNSFNCEKNARLRLAYDLGMLSSMKRQGLPSFKEIKNIEDSLIYPSVEQINLSIQYLRLPVELKEYIQKTIGDEPFDLIKTLKANKLLDI